LRAIKTGDWMGGDEDDDWLLALEEELLVVG